MRLAYAHQMHLRLACAHSCVWPMHIHASGLNTLMRLAYAHQMRLANACSNPLRIHLCLLHAHSVNDMIIYHVYACVIDMIYY